jgi:flagellum-specific peptidoglycan hydrolase FlgJ
MGNMLMTKLEFINRMNTACDEATQKNARFNKSVVYAQAALESNWGNSELALKANNLFSIKVGTSWAGEKIWLPGPEWDYRSGWYRHVSAWRKYACWTDCILDYADIIADVTWYQNALEHLDDPELFLKAILPDGTHPGWANDPDYYQKVLKIAVEIANLGGPKWV